MKTLTIIIPTYNMDKYLRRCLDSLIIDEEGMKQLEVLVINDGSKDSSSQIAHEYENNYPDTFRVIDKENGNYGSCINKGLKEASGKYIKVLDADDFFDIFSFSNYLKYIKSRNEDLIITDFNIVNENQKVVKRYIANMISDHIYYIKDIQNTNLFEVMMHGFTYRTQLLREIKYHQTEGISYTDQQWVCIPFLNVRTISYCPCNLYQYLIGREGQTMEFDIRIKKTNDYLTLLFDMVIIYERFKNEGCNENVLMVKNRILFLIKDVYRMIFFVGNDETMHSLARFEEKIKDRSKDIYNSSNNISIANKINFKFIKYWRRNNYKRISFLQYIYKCYLMIFK